LEETPRSYCNALAAGRAVALAVMLESSRSWPEVRSEIYRDDRPTTIDELDDSEDPHEDEVDAPWEEPAHVTHKRARGHRGGKKVAAKVTRPWRSRGLLEFQGLCLLYTQPGHRVAGCTMLPMCLLCGDMGHMARECTLPRPPRPCSPADDGDEPAWKRTNNDDHAHREEVGVGGLPGWTDTTH
jgi:hypothetical protein